MSPSKRSAAVAEMPRRLFLLDGHSLAYRAFFALPPTLATSSGTVTNAVYGFTSMLIKLLAEEKPDLIAVFFDSGAPTIRLAKDADYKAGRPETPGDFRPQLGLIEEVLDAMRIPVLRIADGNEADDAIGALAVRACEQDIDATIVTADRDFFQLVRPGITVMFNRKGISDIVRYDEHAVTERYGITPSQYLDFVALKGDTSDNIPGVPGVGDKTAAKLVNQFGTVEELLANTDMLKGKQKENVEASAGRLGLNKDLARIDTGIELPVDPDDCVMGEWDADEVRRLFTSLEFRSLFDRLQEIGHVKPNVDVAELDLREVAADELPSTWSGGGPVGVQSRYRSTTPCAASRSLPAAHRLRTRPSRASIRSRRSSPTPARRSGPTTPRHSNASRFDPAARSPVWRSTRCSPATCSTRRRPTTSSVDSPRATSALMSLVLEQDRRDEGQLFSDASWREVAAEAAAIALLAPVMEERIDQHGLRSLLDDVELPLSSVLARMEARGIRLDVDYLEEMGDIGPRPHGHAEGRGLHARGRGVQPRTRRRSCARSSTTSSVYSRGRRRQRASSQPMRACSRSSVTRTRSSTRCCSGASSTS